MDGLIQAWGEFGPGKFIGAFLIIAFFIYCVFGVKHNKGTNSSTSESSSTPTDTNNTGAGGV